MILAIIFALGFGTGYLAGQFKVEAENIERYCGVYDTSCETIHNDYTVESIGD